MSGITRRTVLGGASCGLAMLAAAPAWARLPHGTLALFDARYGDARRFAAAAERFGAMPMPIDADPVSAWRRLDLGPVARIIGLGNATDRMVATALAIEAGGRLTFEAEHDGRGRDHIVHHTRLGSAFRADDAGWAERLAARLMGTAADGSAGAAPAAPDFPGTLCSWAIALWA